MKACVPGEFGAIPISTSFRNRFESRLKMSILRRYIKRTVGLSLMLVILLTTAAFGQTPQPNNKAKEITATLVFPLEDPEKKVAAPEPNRGVLGKTVTSDNPKPKDVESEIATVKAENAAVREQLRRMEEQQKAMLELIEGLQRRLDGAGATAALPPAPPTGPPLSTDASPALPASDAANNSPDPAPASTKTTPADERYHDGIVLWQTPDDVKVPFLIRFNNNTQIRYLNTLDSDQTFTDHLGVVREVHRRNDFTVNRSMFILGGYIFDKRARYSLTVWTSAGAASIIVAGNIGWQFNKRLTLMGGYTGVPGSRSLVNTFPYYTASDRSMADNFFRPGFTQGVWATGELGKGFNYIAFVGNSINTLNISATKIDTKLLASGSVWWEPLGRYAEPGKSVNMYDDYFAT